MYKVLYLIFNRIVNETTDFGRHYQSVVKVARAPRPFLRPPDKAQRREHTGSM